MNRATLIASFLVVVLVAAVFLYFRDTTGPVISISPNSGPVSGSRELVIPVEDEGSDLKQLTVTVSQGDRTREVLSKTYPAGTRSGRESITLDSADLQEGSFSLEVTATDRSIYHFGAGNTTTQSHSFEYDAKPPMVGVLSTSHNLRHGGAGLVVYTLSEEPAKTGVAIGDSFYPGYRQQGDFYAALFAYPFNADPDTFPPPRVVAVDQAGNRGDEGIYYRLLPRGFSEADIDLSDPFLTRIQAEFGDTFPATESPLELFLKVNRQTRIQNRQALAEYGRQTSPTPQWQGAFRRQPDAAPLGAFGERRSYYYQGKKVDEQTHLGIDLASVAHAPVQAANDGHVVYADELGIYGNCVIIDHGMGLQTLYGHLSRLGVQADETVEKGQIIAHTGASGLAAGDHLHFGVVISGVPVDPIEWWDRSWIKNNVMAKLKMGAELADRQ
ncbi:MAG: peptidoglycan DD-metalloendopeptidase family protein [Desulfuromonadales bacterium]|nr:peptidoglycan DD-metalloendopeptidase family protein [Desulfuromonadales bacterium]NIR33552.1 peptidoglycan DD-metalloendopeptidase family protein [Desulfuromonadales bacterium]NIS41142.1 peptidoglycan DD-metalloendopeptidase family protein [Desulfuromonadales bacterium]